MAENNKKYLDQGGLAKVFELIAGKYATNAALKNLSDKIGEWNAEDLQTIAEALAQAQKDITEAKGDITTNSRKIEANEKSIKDLQSTLAALTGGEGDEGLSLEEIADLLGQLNGLEIDQLATKEDVANATDDMATKTWVEEQEYLTEHQSLEEYAKTAEVVSKETYESDKETFATKAESDGKYATKNDIEGMATQEWVKEQEYLTEEDLNDYAKTAEVVSKETYESDKETFATKTDVEDAIEELGIDDYLKKEEANKTFVSKSELEDEIGKLDLSNTYLTKTEANSTYETIENVAAKADKTEAIGKAEYNKEGKKIVFTAVDGETKLGEVDCTDFIKDGMVENVEIKEGKLVITFNTDSGKEDAIELELTDIFNADNYYDKTAADAKFLSIETYNSLALSDEEIQAAFGE